MFAYWKNAISYLNDPQYTIVLLDNRLEFAEICLDVCFLEKRMVVLVCP